MTNAAFRETPPVRQDLCDGGTGLGQCARVGERAGPLARRCAGAIAASGSII